MNARRVVLGWCMSAGLALALASCGDGGGTTTATTGGADAGLTIYSSMPLRGEHARSGRDIADAEMLALRQAGGRAGQTPVRLVSLDDTEVKEATWTPRQASRNARQATRDATTIAYLGDFDPGASAISIPLLSEDGILQVSPATTTIGLTQADGADKGEPEKYYPTGKRTFARVIPADDGQAAAQIAYQQAQDCRATFLLYDDEVYGKSLADLIQLRGPQSGLTVAGEEGLDPGDDDHQKTVDRVKATGADCVFLGADSPVTGAKVFGELHAALPQARLFGPHLLASPVLAAGLGSAMNGLVHLTTPALPQSRLPPAAQRFARAFRSAFGRAPGVYAMFGYEAMRATLSAIRAAGPDADDRRAVRDAFFAIKDRASVLGRYSIDPAGDTSLSAYAGETVRDGHLVFDRLLESQAR